MFLKYIDYKLTEGGSGAYVYHNLFIDKNVYFKDITFETIKEMECLLHTLEIIKEKDNLDLVIQYVKDMIEIRNCGLQVEQEYHKKQYELQTERINKINKCGLYVKERKKRCERNIMKLKDSEATDEIIKKEIKKRNEDIKDYVVNLLGEEYYKEKYKEKYNVTNY